MSLHPLLSHRRSIRAFDPSTEITSEELAALLEAARWAPSSFNTQPWRFVVGRRDEGNHKKIFASLVPPNQSWAATAPLLLVAAHLTRLESGQELPYASYDLGQSVAHLSVQATALSLYVHQMAGFDHDALHAELGLPEHIRPKVVIAVGRSGDPAVLPDDLREREHATRERHPAGAILLS